MINLVLSMQRTGSSFLFLHFHDTLSHVCYEPYNSDTVRSEYKLISTCPEFKNRTSYPIPYLKVLSFFGVIDIKLELMPEVVKCAIFNNPDQLKIVILKRENVLAQYISLMTAARSKVFYSESPKKEIPMRISIEDFQVYLKKTERLYSEATKKINDFKLVTYEKMSIPEIVNYFGEQLTGIPKIKKLHADYSFIENRDELNATFPEFKI